MFERLILKQNLSKNKAISIIIADGIYEIAGLARLITGILRVKYYGQGGEFCTGNTIFWIKVSLYTIVGLISFYLTSLHFMGNSFKQK